MTKRTRLSIDADKRIKALHGGKRISADGNIYYESRSNRSDINRTKKFSKGGSIKQEFLEHPLLIERRSDGTLDVDFDSNNSTGWRYSTDDIGEAVAIMINSEYKKNPKIREIAITPKQLKKSDEKTIVYWLSGGNKAWRFNQADYKHSFDKTYDDLWEKDAKKIKKEIIKLKNIGEVMDFYYKEYLEYPHFYSDALENGYVIDEEDEDYAKGGGVGKIRTISNWNELVKAIRFNGGVHNFRGINISSKGEYTDSAIVNFLNKNGFDFQAKEESLLDRSSGKYRLFKIISTRKSDEVKRLALHILEMGLDTEWSAYYEPLGENPTIKSKVEKYGIDLPLKDRVDRLIYANGGGVGDKKVGDTIKIKPSGMSAKIEEVLSYGYEVTSSNGRTMYVDFDFIDFESKKEYAKGGEISEDRINEVLDNYMIAALWSSTDMDTDEPLDANYSVSDIAPNTKIQMYKDVKKFMEDNLDAIEESGSSDEQLGHDLWLSRNGHGAGFFDRGYGDVGDKLQDAASDMKGADLEVGDDGLIHQMGVFKKGGALKRSKSSIAQDKNLKALHGGKRVSADGNVYYENRENRSDVNRTKKFAEGGELTEKEQDLKSKIEAILNKVVPNFYHRVWIYKSYFGQGKNLGIVIAASDYAINNVRGQYPQAVSLTLDLSSLELNPQVFGGNGGRVIYRKPNMEDPSEKYLAMKSVKVPFRTPTKEEGAVLKAIEKFADNYKKTLRENLDTLKYTDIVDYDALLSDKKMADGGEMENINSALEYLKENYPNPNELSDEDYLEMVYDVRKRYNLDFEKGNEVAEKHSDKYANGGEIGDFEQKLKDAFKQTNKWHFLGGNINGHEVQLKVFVGVKECDVQIFKKDGLHVNLGKNYVGKRETMKMIMDALSTKFENGGGVGKIKNIKYKDVIDNYNKITLPENVFLKGNKYVGEASIVDGYNGYDSTPQDGLFGVFEPVGVGQNIWNGFKGYLQDDRGFYLRAKQRRGHNINTEDGKKTYAKGGGVGKSKHLHSGRYISLDITPNGNLKITLNEDARAEVLEMRDDDKSESEIMYDLFDDVRGNSELMYFDDAGEQGFGMTSAPCITDGYYYDDDGELTDEGHEDSELYYFNDYMISSFIDKMIDDGYVVFDRAGKYAKGGKISSSFNEDTDSWFDGLSELSSDMKGNEKMDKLLSISDKEASKENIEKFKSILEDCECPKPELKKNIINHLDKILDSKYKNEFKNSFGGKRNSGGKTSAASEFLSMFNQAATYKFAKGGRVGKNEDVIESFLTSSEQVETKNLSTHYNEYDKEILLRNYYTLIATRKGDVVKILDKKFSPTTSKIQNELKRVVKEKGLTIKDVKEFEDGGSVGEFDLVGIEGSILKSLSSGKEVSVDKLTSYLGRKPKFEENVVGFKVRKCFLRPYFKVAE